MKMPKGEFEQRTEFAPDYIISLGVSIPYILLYNLNMCTIKSSRVITSICPNSSVDREAVSITSNIPLSCRFELLWQQNKNKMNK